jgi:hypothetical protein
VQQGLFPPVLPFLEFRSRLCPTFFLRPVVGSRIAVRFRKSGSLAVCWVVTIPRFHEALTSAFSVLSFLDFGRQIVFRQLCLFVFIWDLTNQNSFDIDNCSLVRFLDSYREHVPFKVKPMICSDLTSHCPRLTSFRRSVLFGRFFLQEFISTRFILHMDCDIRMAKPWLVPLADDISMENQSDKLLWGGRDWGLFASQGAERFHYYQMRPDTYINAGFFLFRNVPETKRLMNASLEMLIANPAIWFLDQTTLNLVFNTYYKGFLSARFDKWLHCECRPWTINCHGSLPRLFRRVTDQMRQAYLKWGGTDDQWSLLFK